MRLNPDNVLIHPSLQEFLATLAEVVGVVVGMAGREGMVGAQLALGVVTIPLHALVQGEGEAWRINLQIAAESTSSCS